MDKAIYIETPDKSIGRHRQNIHIAYGLIGFIPLEALTKAAQIQTVIARGYLSCS